MVIAGTCCGDLGASTRAVDGVVCRVGLREASCASTEIEDSSEMPRVMSPAEAPFVCGA